MKKATIKVYTVSYIYMYINTSTQGVSRSALNVINNGNGQQNTNNKKYENNN